MNWPYELQIGWRYTRAGRDGRRNAFISFISLVSMIGIALGVAVLIVVLSVMNGFQRDVRDKMLSIIAHVEIYDARGNALPDWRETVSQAKLNPQVVGAAPFIAAQALLAYGEDMRGVLVRGISPADEAAVTPIAEQLKNGSFGRLVPGGWGIVLGGELARAMGVKEGDRVSMAVAGGTVTPAGVVPRLKTMTVVGTFDAGHFEYDSRLAMLHVDDAAKLFRVEGPTGVQLRLVDMHAAREVAVKLSGALGPQVNVSDWTRANPNWFRAVAIEKRVMAIILTMIVAVAAFNLVSTLVMTVTDKQADIAILRTLGASPRSIMSVFMIQGAFAGIIGTLAGVVLGLLIAVNVGTIVPAIEGMLQMSLLDKSVYLIPYIPSDPQMGDIVPIVISSLLLAFVMTLYPSWRASRVQPAEALRYE